MSAEQVLSASHDKASFPWNDKFRASGIHLGLSLVVALLAGLLVFGLWYPYPYREISGGRELFLIVVGVDVVLGPLITFVIFNRRKPVKELKRDVAFVVLIQLAALGYGLWTVFIARPVHLVFEIDRFRAVHAVDVDHELLKKKPAEVEAMPLFGPTLLAARPFKDSKESFDATMAALQGAEIGARPDLWRSYPSATADVIAAAKPATQLKTRFAAQAAEIDGVLRSVGRTPENTAYLPMVGRKSFWTVFIDPVTADVVGFIPLDSF